MTRAWWYKCVLRFAKSITLHWAIKQTTLQLQLSPSLFFFFLYARRADNRGRHLKIGLFLDVVGCLWWSPFAAIFRIALSNGFAYSACRFILTSKRKYVTYMGMQHMEGDRKWEREQNIDTKSIDELTWNKMVQRPGSDTRAGCKAAAFETRTARLSVLSPYAAQLKELERWKLWIGLPMMDFVWPW
jgi:hypothetical protein